MKNSTSSNPITVANKAAIETFEVKQALVGIELGATDKSVLQYFDFLSQRIPMSAAYFMHVLPKFTELEALFEKETQSLIGDYTIMDDRQEVLIKEVKESISKYKDMYVEYKLTHGNPLEEVLKTAKELKVDLLAIGQRSDANFHGILAKNLVRKTACNTLIIPDQVNYTLGQILVPIDFSPNSVRALQTAVSINRQLEEKAKIIALHVYEVPPISSYQISKSFGQFENMIKENINDAFEAFLNTYAPEDRSYIEIALVKKDLPNVGRYINQYATEQAIDFMVIGAKGHSKVHLLLMGSTTERIISLNKSIPTLVVR